MANLAAPTNRIFHYSAEKNSSILNITDLYEASRILENFNDDSPQIQQIQRLNIAGDLPLSVLHLQLCNFHNKYPRVEIYIDGVDATVLFASSSPEQLDYVNLAPTCSPSNLAILLTKCSIKQLYIFSINKNEQLTLAYEECLAKLVELIKDKKLDVEVISIFEQQELTNALKISCEILIELGVSVYHGTQLLQTIEPQKIVRGNIGQFF